MNKVKATEMDDGRQTERKDEEKTEGVYRKSSEAGVRGSKLARPHAVVKIRF